MTDSSITQTYNQGKGNSSGPIKDRRNLLISQHPVPLPISSTAARTSRAAPLQAAGLPIREPSPSSTSWRLLVFEK